VNAFLLEPPTSSSPLVGVERHVAAGCEARVGKVRRNEPLGGVQRPPERNLGLRLPTLAFSPKLSDCSREVNSSAGGVSTRIDRLGLLWADEAVRPSNPQRER
jgi:hypothetical protein